ncbi:uncharacterized protein SCHCODRAFT_0105731 [Schizophyllum commune H4-8]
MFADPVYFPKLRTDESSRTSSRREAYATRAVPVDYQFKDGSKLAKKQTLAEAEKTHQRKIRTEDVEST